MDQLAEPRASSIELTGLGLGLLEWGPPGGPLLLAAHGFPDTAWTWRRVAPGLAAAGWRVVAPALRGYAPSTLPADGDLSIYAVAEDLVELADRLGADERSVLVGHDWGAIAASLLAGRAESPFSRYVLVAIPPLAHLNPRRGTLRPWTAAVIRQPAHSWYIAFNQLRGLAERRFDWLARRLWASWAPGYDATEDLAHLAEAVPDVTHARAVISYYRTALGSRMSALSAEPVHPVLFLQGDHDTALDPRFFEVVAPQLAPPSRAVLVEGAGHFPHLDRPEVVLTEMLAELGRPDAAVGR
ncbi:alpha/beta fold hydrolase [Nocardioides sp. Kera G14]|uniref:alpha/beta fold hydrolase n=1 Tax=Nocardioides sp. Kera G14 TaxID=2884264 RepID=UPI001D10F418|nr:alpha/beta fold hydrolase [Nocardioides sp. Kera G14]UDY22256.1 alpha/beta fold hydrolase [Nocardioides sp. Kera G14]